MAETQGECIGVDSSLSRSAATHEQHPAEQHFSQPLNAALVCQSEDKRLQERGSLCFSLHPVPGKLNLDLPLLDKLLKFVAQGVGRQAE